MDRIRLYWVHFLLKKTCKHCEFRDGKNGCCVNIGIWRDDMFCSFWRKLRKEE